MICLKKQEPSETSLKILESLRKTVAKTLETKRRLGHYVVLWDGEKPVLRGDDAPPTKD